MIEDDLLPPIVGIGASAGGIEALRSLFSVAPSASGLAYVVVTHLGPDRESFLHEIIGRFTSMTVVSVTADMPVHADTVYVMAGGSVLSLKAGMLRVRTLAPGQREPKPVDVFFASLAEEQGVRSAGIILSGGDGDGALGIRAIKGRGGLTMAQAGDEQTLRHAGMPAAAMATGMIDFAVVPAEMGHKLVVFAQELRSFEDAAWRKADTQGFHPEPDQLAAIYALLLNKVGHDFSAYKSNTFLRRVHRRMQIAGASGIADYIVRLGDSAEEVRTLFHDLLINVTAFFRDPEAFAALAETVIPHLFEDRGEEDNVRVWVPGCATGEEVYSIAILLREHALTLSNPPAIQIFATDIDEHALAVARAARYPASLLSDMPRERLRQFFQADGASYVVTKDIRELCNFSPHSVLRDPPFSRIDLVSCRNLLIYFAAEAQTHVLPTFHYALRPAGYLFLGPSENVSHFSELFTPVDKAHRLFRCRSEGKASVKLPAVIAAFRGMSSETTTPGGRRAGTTAVELRQLAEARVLERFAPPHVIVNADGDVIHFSARTGRYLEPPVGAPNRQLLTMARKGLRLELRAAFREAMETGRVATRGNVLIDVDGDRIQGITVTVEPFSPRGNDGMFYLILFIDQGEPQPEAVGLLRAVDPIAIQLERELHDTRDRLQSLIEEYETALEELKSSNEELVSLNEELQSSNEELEASREELQSLNEELHTVNNELGGKVDALDLANADLNNLFESTRVATVFLDQDLVIRSFTPTASEIFNLRSSDTGRPLTDLNSHVVWPSLREDVDTVMATGRLIERQIARDEGNQQFLVRMAPYLTQKGTTEGVVLSFVDVTSLTRAEAQQRLLNLELNHRVKNMLAIVIGIARQMERSAVSPTIASERFVDRLHAMSRAFEVLSHENWNGALVGELVRREVQPYDDGRVTVEGPDVRLPPNQALSMGLVLHELVVNAVNHGALASQAGKVAISWRMNEDSPSGEVVINWSERTPEEIVPPSQYGFGLKIVEREGGYNLGGKAVIDFSSHGLDVSLTFPTARQSFDRI